MRHIIYLHDPLGEILPATTMGESEFGNESVSDSYMASTTSSLSSVCRHKIARTEQT